MPAPNSLTARFFENLTSAVLRFNLVVLVCVLAATAFLGLQLRHLKFDTSNEGFLHVDDPALLTYNAFREQFGRDDYLVLAVHSDNLFSFEILKKLVDLHDDLERSVPHLAEVKSLVNARNTRGENDTLSVDRLLDTMPVTAAELETLRKRVLGTPLYVNQFISEDGRYAALLLRTQVLAETSEADLLAGFDEPAENPDDVPIRAYLSDRENDDFVESVLAVVDRHRTRLSRYSPRVLP